MLSRVIFKMSPPSINYFPDNKEAYSKQYHLMNEQNSLFENILDKMKSSKKEKVSDCSNPNCKNVFLTFSKCSSCGKTFCFNCLVKCEICNETICKFCEMVKYGKKRDISLCPNCNNEDIEI